MICFSYIKKFQMKKFYLLFVLFGLLSNAQISTSPSPVIATNAATLTFDKTGTGLAAYTGIIYAYIGVTVNGARFQNIKGSPVFTSPLHPQMTQVTASTYSLSIAPDLYTYFGVPTNSSITEICVVFRAADAASQTVDYFVPVGAFQYNLTSPTLNSNSIIATGSNVLVTANNTNGAATYNLLANGVSINTQTTVNYSYTDNNVTVNKNYELRITQTTTTFSAKFAVVINPGSLSGALPAGVVDGINYNSTDPTKAILVLNAPTKSFIYVAGSFNNWQPDATFAMKRDTASGSTRYWIELTGLTPGQIYAYQYWVCDVVNVPAGSPAIVKTADPFSKLVLSPFDDPEIIALGVFPNLPVYATIAPGQEREVTVLQTGPNSLFNYTWSAATTNFVKPKKKDLTIYEVLVRDFDTNKSYQDLIDKIDYFKNLNVNAIQLMPVMEFEGNLSWGYNTVFHMALDKRYGPPAKLKQFIDLCHQNGIAVILDVALNHVFGRSPLERMWMLDTDNDGWANTNANGERTTSENPYINLTPKHAYNVGSDINHFRETGPGGNLANTYTIETIKTWIQDYKIDGFRWDLTKGFTQNCTATDQSCTNGYQADRVGKLKYYADKQWEIDPNFYVIFEHLGVGGSATEELEWADYLRNGDQKGIMQWKKLTDEYANIVKGNLADVSAVANANNRMVGYAESHDEERVGYKALVEAGQTQGNIAKIHQRLAAMGAIHLLVPGPKMIWHFGELGWEKSLWSCNNGTVSYTNPDCKLDTKPQPQWAENWQSNAARAKIYNDWATMINIKKTDDVFENGTHAWNFAAAGSPRLDIYTSTTQSANLSYVFVRTNFSDNTLSTQAFFPFTGTWTNLMDGSTVNVTDTAMNIAIEPGGYRVYGNKPSLSTTSVLLENSFVVMPNPANNYFELSKSAFKVEIFSITGQLVKSFKNTVPNEQFQISDLNSGLYIVKVTDEDRFEKNIKLLKQ